MTTLQEDFDLAIDMLEGLADAAGSLVCEKQLPYNIRAGAYGTYSDARDASRCLRTVRAFLLDEEYWGDDAISTIFQYGEEVTVRYSRHKDAYYARMFLKGVLTVHGWGDTPVEALGGLAKNYTPNNKGDV